MDLLPIRSQESCYLHRIMNLVITLTCPPPHARRRLPPTTRCTNQVVAGAELPEVKGHREIPQI